LLSGGNVTGWIDRGPHSAPAAPFGEAPLFVASDASWNGQASIRFDRDNFESLYSAGVGARVTGAFTVCCAVVYDINDAYQKCWGFAGPDNDAVGLGCDNAGRLTLAQLNGPADVLEYGFVELDVTVPRIITVVCTPRVGETPGTVVVYDGATELAMSASTNIAASNFDQFLLGTGSGLDMEGSIAECVVVSQALTPEQVAQLAAFVAAGKLQ
jgi:hypothetical protein